MTPKQRQALRLLARRRRDESLDDVAHRVGVRPRTLGRWLAEPAFREALLRRLRNEMSAWAAAARDVLLKRALEDGDKECLKIVLSLSGLWKKDAEPDAHTPDGDGLRALSDEALLARLARLEELAGRPALPSACRGAAEKPRTGPHAARPDGAPGEDGP